MSYLLASIITLFTLASAPDSEAFPTNTRRYDLISQTGDCNGIWFVIRDNYENKRHRIFLKKPCQLIDMSVAGYKVAAQVARTAGLGVKQPFALLSRSGDCNGMTFYLWDNDFSRPVTKRMGNNNCQLIDYHAHLNPAAVGTQVANYFNLPKRFHLRSSSGDCNGVTFFVIDDHYNMTHKIKVSNPCQIIDMSVNGDRQSRQVAEKVGLLQPQRFALFGRTGDCNGMSFRVFDKKDRRVKSFHIGKENCNVIDYHAGKNPAAVAKQAAKYVNLGRRRR